MGKKAKPVTREELLWLQKNWSPGETAFREWVMGSAHAHALVKRLIEEALKR